MNSHLVGTGLVMLVTATILMGCETSDEPETPGNGQEVTAATSPGSAEIDTAQEALKSEGFLAVKEGPGQLDVGSLRIEGGEGLGDATISVIYYADTTKALKERESLTKVFTGRLAGRGVVEGSSDDLVTFYIAREGQLSDSQIGELRRVKEVVEANR